MELEFHSTAVATAIARLMIAAVAGGILGLPTEARRRPAGVRTHSLACLGAALFCVVVRDVAEASPDGLARIIQGVVTGVGFIAGAAILRGERDPSVQGINTAATVWIAAGVGCAVGLMSNPLIGIVGAAIAMAIDVALLLVARRLRRRGPPGDAGGVVPPG